MSSQERSLVLGSMLLAQESCGSSRHGRQNTHTEESLMWLVLGLYTSETSINYSSLDLWPQKLRSIRESVSLIIHLVPRHSVSNVSEAC